MELNKLAELQARYATCPSCKSNRIADGKMVAIHNRFQRSCTCGYSVEVVVTGDTFVELGPIDDPINLDIAAMVKQQGTSKLN